MVEEVLHFLERHEDLNDDFGLSDDSSGDEDILMILTQATLKNFSLVEAMFFLMKKKKRLIALWLGLHVSKVSYQLTLSYQLLAS